MARRKTKNMIDTAAGETVRLFAAAAVAVAKLRNDIPDRELIDSIAKDGSTRGDGLVVLDTLLKTLAQSGRVYAHHDDVMITDARNTKFRLLSMDGRAERAAGARLTNIVAGVKYQMSPKTGEIESWEFPIPDSICEQLFAMDRCTDNLPAVTTYATHSVFDKDFQLRAPGYHSEQQILVQGLSIIADPATLPMVSRRKAGTVAEAIERLPPHLHRLLKDFDFADVVDLTNTVGALLMGLLMNHFVEDGHPMVVIHGNQPSIGKSLLAKAIGMVFDGRRAAAIKKSGDEEFDKLLCAMLKKRRRMVFLDNLRDKLDSERIEQIVTSPTIMIRILGGNEFGEWPNDVLFVLTSNNLQAGRDLVTRNLTINLYTEGDPKRRQESRKSSKPLAYAQTHRAEILGELASMAMRWVDAGRPDGDLNTRFDKVSQVVGGILDVNGFPGFASNAETAAMEADEGLQRMAELGEILVREQKPGMVVKAGGDLGNAGVLAKDWVGEFVRHHLIDPKPDATTKSKAIAVGKVLSAYLDRTLMVDAAGQSWAVTMRKRPGSSGGKTYYFAEIEQVAERGDAPAGANDTLRIVEVAEAERGDGGCAAVVTPNATPTATPVAIPSITPAPAAPSRTGWMGAAAALVTTPAASEDQQASAASTTTEELR
jgi:hypothetical protein